MTYTRIIIVLASLLAELCCIYPLYFLLATGSGARPVVAPWPFIALAATVAAANLVLSTGRRRLLTVLLFNLALAVIAGGLVVQHTFFPASSFFTLSWAAELFSSSNGWTNLSRYWLLLVFILWVYYRAALLAREAPGFTAAIARFDISLGCLFGFLLIGALTKIAIPGAFIWMLVMLLSNALAMASTQSGNRLARQSAWVGPAFLALVLLPGALVIIFFYPQLSYLGAMTYDAGLPVVQCLANILLAILLWLLRHTHMVPDRAPATATSSPSPAEISPEVSHPSWITGLIEILGRLAILLFLLAITAAILYLIYRLFCWLWRYQEPVTAKSPGGKSLFGWWRHFVLLLSSWLVALRLALLPWLKINQGPVASYRALLRWGKRQGQPRLSHETPYEYLQRLGQLFPENQGDLSLITEYYVAYRYGNKLPASLPAEGEPQAALRRLSLALPRRAAKYLKITIRTLKSRYLKRGN